MHEILWTSGILYTYIYTASFDHFLIQYIVINGCRILNKEAIPGTDISVTVSVWVSISVSVSVSVWTFERISVLVKNDQDIGIGID